MTLKEILRRRTQIALIVVIVGLVVSGVTAIPVIWEVNLLVQFLGNGDAGNPGPALREVLKVRDGLVETNEKYPFLAYGLDWLAFAHVVIAIAFIGPLRDPVRNIWVITFGIIACVLVIPMALIFGPIREIPFPWRLIDCSFGLIGMIPLLLARKWTIQLSRIK